MKKILVISPVATHPQDGQSRQRIFSLLNPVRARGHRITYVLVRFEDWDVMANTIAAAKK